MIVVLLTTTALGFIFMRLSRGINETRNRVRRTYIILICILLTLQSGLRNIAVGPDTFQYYSIFNTVKRSSWYEIVMEIKAFYTPAGKEAFYDLIQKVFQTFSGSFRIFLIMVAAFFFIALGKFIYQNTSTVSQTIFAFILYLALFYSVFSITTMRQTFPEGIVLLSFSYVKQKKLLKFILCVLLASCIHKSAMVSILIYPLFWNRNIKLLYILSGILLIMTFLFRQRIISYSYFFYYQDSFNIMGNSLPKTFVGLMAACFIFISLNLKKIKTKYSTLIGICNIVLPGFILSPALGTQSGSIMRVIDYFSLFLIILLPKIIDSYKIPIRTLYYRLSIFILAFFIIKNTGPYAFFWQPLRLGENYGYNLIIQK